MNINTDKIAFGKIIPVGDKIRQSKYRTAENSFSDEQTRLIEDEVVGIKKTGKGFCFNKIQLEAIKNKLKEVLSSKEFESFEYKFDGFCFIITIKKSCKKHTKKQDLVLA